MPVVYVTYTQNGVKKKGSINESQYDALASNPSISDLTVYPNPRLMEQAYNGSKGNSAKRMLLG